MIKIYLSPSTQPRNIFWDKKHNEEQVMNWVTDYLVEFLNKYNVEVIRGAKDVPTTERIKRANSLKVDYYLSIHSNAAGGRGCETFYQVGINHSSSVKSRSKDYALKLNNDMSNITITNTNPGDRGIKFKTLTNKQDGNHELRGVMFPANLVEVEFHDTEVGYKWILDNLQLIGETLGKSIVDIFNLKLKPVIPTLPVDHFYFVQTGAYKTLADAELEAKKIASYVKQEVGIKYGNKNALRWIKGIK